MTDRAMTEFDAFQLLSAFSDQHTGVGNHQGGAIPHRWRF